VFLVIQGIGEIRLTRSAVRQLRRLESRGGVRVTLTVTRHARGHRKPGMVPDPQQWTWRACVGFKNVPVAPGPTSPLDPDAP
jgi:uncharacterized protein (DUF58 family)